MENAYITEHSVTDFRRILYGEDILTFADFSREHKRCLEFIKQSVADSIAKHKIVVIHHVPSFQLMAPEFQGSRINGAFTVGLTLIKQAKDLTILRLKFILLEIGLHFDLKNCRRH